MNTSFQRQPSPQTPPKALTKISGLARSYVKAVLDDLYSGLTQQRRAPKRHRSTRLDATALPDLLSVYRRLRKMGEALFIWHTSTNFADQEGRPRSLPRAGRISLTSLAMCVTKSRRDAVNIVNDLIQMRILRREKSTFSPLQRSAVLSTDNVVAGAYAGVIVGRLIRTLQNNFAQAGPPRFERSVLEVKISKSDLPLFHAFARQQGEYFIDAVDDWLAQRTRRRPRSSKTLAVGVGAFAWVEPAACGQFARRSTRERSRASDTT